MNNFRKTMNDYSTKMNNIYLMRGENFAQEEDLKNKNTFFEAFDRFIEISDSIYIIKKFNNFSIEDKSKDYFNKCLNIINKNFENQVINNALSLKKYIELLNKNLELEWRRYCCSIDVDFIDALEIFVQVSNNKREILDTINGIKGINTWPLNKGIITRYYKSKEKGEKAIADVHFDEEIEEFLRKIKEKQANLLDLSPKILEWIKENDLGKNINLSIKNYN